MLAAFLLFLLLTTPMSASECAPAVECSPGAMPMAGDADCSGGIDSADLAVITQRLFCVACVDCGHPTASDTNFDLALSAADLTGLVFLAVAPTATPTSTNTATASATPSTTATATPSPTASATLTATHTNTAIITTTPPPTATATPSPTASVTLTPTHTGTPTSTPTVTDTPTTTPTRTPTTLACGGGLNEAVFPIDVDVLDATIRRSGAGHPPSGTFVLDSFERDGLTQRSLTSQFTTGNMLFRWRTATQPNGVPWPLDVAVVSAHFRAFYGSGALVNNDARAFVLEWYDFGQLGIEDWSNEPPLNDAPSFASSVAISDIAGGYRTIPLMNLEQVQLDGPGVTGLRTHISGPAPAGRNQVEIRAFEHSNTPAQLIVCWTGTVPAPTSTPTATPTAVPPQARLPLGQIQVLSIPTPTEDPYEYRLSVTCPGIAEAEEVSLFIGDPIDATLRGTILFASGFIGDFRWTAYGPGNARVLQELREGGFRTVELRWGRNWYRGTGNGHHLFACRPATVARWIYDNLHVLGPEQAFCATGHSNGASQVAYMLARYGLGDILSLALLEGGPNWSRLDLGCIWDPTSPHLWWDNSARRLIDWGFGPSAAGFGPCAQQDESFRGTFQAASVAFDGLEHILPNTLVWFVIGAGDATVTAVHGRVYYDKLLAEGSPLVRLDVIPGAGHVTAATTLGGDTIRDAFLEQCIPR